ncbi:MAG: hypothetical protein R2706_04840 [Acidimicrobiales bacterium]
MIALLLALGAFFVILGAGSSVVPPSNDDRGVLSPRPFGPVYLGLVGLGMLTSSPLLSVVVPLVVALVRRRLAHRARAAARRAETAAVPAFIDAAIQRLQAGASYSSALVAALREEPALSALPAVQSTLAGIASGGSVADEFSSLAETHRREWSRLLSATTSVVLSGGGAGTTALDRLAETVRANSAAEAEAAAQSGQATASAAVLGALPLVFALVIGTVDADARHLYLSTWIGAICLLVAVVADGDLLVDLRSCARHEGRS